MNTNKTGVDHTERMNSWARDKVGQLAGEGLCGFIFKSKSPSSGMERVKVYDKNNVPRAIGVGLVGEPLAARVVGAVGDRCARHHGCGAGLAERDERAHCAVVGVLGARC